MRTTYAIYAACAAVLALVNLCIGSYFGAAILVGYCVIAGRKVLMVRA